MGADRSTWLRWGGVVLLVLVAAVFSFYNAGERVTLHLGFTILYRISLVGLFFGAFLFGMITMFLFGLRYDRRIRNMLRAQAYRSTPDDRYPDPHLNDRV